MLNYGLVAAAAMSAFVALGAPTGAAAAPPLPPACSITGSSAGETLTGTPGPDVICGLGGDDILDGRGGDDVLVGGPGADTLQDPAGDNTLFGGEGDDSLRAGLGADTLVGGPGTDRLSYADRPVASSVTARLAGAATDPLLPETDDGGQIFTSDNSDGDVIYDDIEFLRGHAGRDTLGSNRTDAGTIDGQGGNDTIEVAGYGGPHTIRGGDGDDVIHGGADDDVIAPGGGDDTVVGGLGSDTVYGGSEDDGDDALDGGETWDRAWLYPWLLAPHSRDLDDGNERYLASEDCDPVDFDEAGLPSCPFEYVTDEEDLVFYGARTTPTRVQLAATTSNQGRFDPADPSQVIERDRVVRFERVIAGSGDDLLTGTWFENQLIGNLGDDTIIGSAGPVNPLFRPTAPNADLLQGGQGSDRLEAQANGLADVLNCGAGADTLVKDGVDIKPVNCETLG